MSANEKQIGGLHYKDRKIQHWDYAAQLPYLEGLATKYIDRHARKGGKEDLLKAIHTLEKMIEEYYPERPLGHDLEELLEEAGTQEFSAQRELAALNRQKEAHLMDTPDLSPMGIVEMIEASLCPDQSQGNHSWSHVYRHGRDGRLIEVRICDYCKMETDK